MTNASLIRRAIGADGPACAAIVDAWIEKTPWMERNITYVELEKLSLIHI